MQNRRRAVAGYGQIAAALPGGRQRGRRCRWKTPASPHSLTTRFGVCRGVGKGRGRSALGISSPGQLLSLCARPGSHWRGIWPCRGFAPQGRASFRGYRRQSRQAPHRFWGTPETAISTPSLHYDASDPDDARRTAAAITKLDDAALEFGGSLSGEHGGGCLRMWASSSALTEL